MTLAPVAQTILELHRIVGMNVGSIRDFKDLRVWQHSMELSRICFEIIRTAPRYRTRGIATQLLEAANSVHANIAEGHGRPTRKDYVRFIGISRASLREVESHLLDLERNRGVRGSHMDRALSLVDQCGRELTTLARRLQESEPLPAPPPRTGNPHPTTSSAQHEDLNTLP